VWHRLITPLKPWLSGLQSASFQKVWLMLGMMRKLRAMTAGGKCVARSIWQGRGEAPGRARGGAGFRAAVWWLCGTGKALPGIRLHRLMGHKWGCRQHGGGKQTRQSHHIFLSFL
tara:strand:- start:9 stop:353 length:345 start_codon:yes stop_codon:yes gene_type:complete